MKKKTIRFVSVLMMCLVVLSTSVFAVPYNNYTYTESGVYPEPTAYTPKDVIDSGTLGLENLEGKAMKDPQNFFLYDNGFMIISDTGNNRLIVLDKDLKTVKQIISTWTDENGEEQTFNTPNGTDEYEDEDLLYVCDTENKRVVVFKFDRTTEQFAYELTYNDPDISQYFQDDEEEENPDEPSVTEEPTVTEEPAATEEPTPEATATPEVTATPEATAAPEATAEVTPDPDATAAPEATAEPDTTPDPEATTEPDATEEPTASPEATPANEQEINNNGSSSGSSTEVTYRPLKIVVDNSKRMFVVSKDCYRGLVELTSEGVFSKFYGATKTKQSLSSLLKRLFSANAKSKLQQNLSTEYSNVTIDDEGFIYGTISQLAVTDLSSHFTAKTEVGAALRKLNAAGSDVLQRQGLVPSSGDDGDGSDRATYSYFTDVVVSANGLTSCLDSQKGRVFTYTSTGELLFIFGGLGTRPGNLTKKDSREELTGFTMGTSLAPVAIELLDDDETYVVLDSTGAQMTTYVPTEYGKILREAVNSHEERRYDDAVAAWNKVLSMSSNSAIAYKGVGKVLYLDASEELDSKKQKATYLDAAEYFKMGFDQDDYAKAFYKYRDKVLEEIMPALMTVIIIIVVAAVIFGWYKKLRHFIKTGGKKQ